MCNVRLQEQKVINDVGFQQRHPSLQLQQPNVFQSIMNVQSQDELYRARTILQFVLKNLHALVAELFLYCIQFQYEPMVLHLHHRLLSPRHFLDGHGASPVNGVKGLCLSFQRNQSNHGIFYRLPFSHHLQLNFSTLQFSQMSLLAQWLMQYFVPSHQLKCVESRLIGFQHQHNLHD